MVRILEFLKRILQKPKESKVKLNDKITINGIDYIFGLNKEERMKKYVHSLTSDSSDLYKEYYKYVEERVNQNKEYILTWSKWLDTKWELR